MGINLECDRCTLLLASAMLMYIKPSQQNIKEQILSESIDDFLLQVEKKAYRMAEIATKNSADALDIVQDTMIKLVSKYSDKPYEEWRPLFYRILQSRIADYFRRRKVQQSIFFWKFSSDQTEDDPISQASDHIQLEQNLEGERKIAQVIEALKCLPTRQQQCFLLRSWEGMDVKQTALAMGCSEGSVKTHYSRAKAALKLAIGEYND